MAESVPSLIVLLEADTVGAVSGCSVGDTGLFGGGLGAK